MSLSTRKRPRYLKPALAAVAALAAVLTVAGCAAGAAWGEEVNRALNGVGATMTTYDQSGRKIDSVHGESFRVSRDDRFDTANSDGTSKQDSQVLLISVGDSHISHVGSSLILAQDGVEDLIGQVPNTVDLRNTEAGHPWLNDLLEKNRNLWQGKAKTLLIRSQSGDPIAVFAGAQVEAFPTDVPKSTAFRVDGKYVFVYRCDYTVYDTDLLQ